MTIRHLKIFVSVYQCESISRAAERLYMTQPAVTRAVQELEAHYGVQLFERFHRRLRRTECASQFYAYALHILDSFDRMETSLHRWDEQGVLRAGTTITIGNVLLPDVLAAFSADYPQLQVYAQVSNGEPLVHALQDNRLDLAVIEGHIVCSHLQSEVIARDELMLLLPPDDPRRKAPYLSLADISRDRLLLRERGSVGRSLVDHVFAMHHLPVEPAMESVSTQAIIQAVYRGLGVSLLPRRLAEPAIASGLAATVPIDDASFERTHSLVWHEHKFLSPPILALMEVFRRLASACFG